MNKLIPFDFNNNPVRVISDDPNNPLFVAKDVAIALGYTNHSKAIRDHCDGVTNRYPLETSGGKQLVNFIDEENLYRLIFGSKLKSARSFQKWVFKEVLPSIRKTGSYTAPEPTGLTKLQKGHIHQSVMNLARNSLFSHASYFGKLKRRFGVSKYDEISKYDYGVACQFLGVSPRISLLIARNEPKTPVLPVLKESMIDESNLRKEIYQLSQQLQAVNNAYNKVVRVVYKNSKTMVH